MPPTPYDSRIDALRSRIKRHGGSDQRLRQKLGKQRLNRYDYRQQNRPPEPSPWSGQYETTVSQLGQNRDFTKANLAYEEDQLRRSYGFDDTSDPFSRARQLQENYQRANRGTLNNYAASGQLYAGSLSNARNIDRTNFEESYDATKKDYEARLRENLMRSLEADREYEQGVTEAEAERLEEALNERVDPSEAPGKPAWVKKLQKQLKRGGQNKGGGGRHNRPRRRK